MTRLLVFDSGVGGLSVAAEIRRALPLAEMIYVADDAGFPYGEWADGPLTERIVGLVGELIALHAPDAAVIACNTASTLVLPPLRARFELPFVGTVPAIKPAAWQTRTGVVSVLGTPGTIRRDYTRDLIDSFAATCHVRLVGCGALAALAERHMRGEPVDDAAVLAEIAPAFFEQDSRRTDTVVLACTHYPFLLDRFARVAPWPVTYVDPAPAIARRVVTVVGEAAASGPGGGAALLTSGKPWPAALLPKLVELELAGSAPTLAAAGEPDSMP